MAFKRQTFANGYAYEYTAYEFGHSNSASDVWLQNLDLSSHRHSNSKFARDIVIISWILGKFWSSHQLYRGCRRGPVQFGNTPLKAAVNSKRIIQTPFKLTFIRGARFHLDRFLVRVIMYLRGSSTPTITRIPERLAIYTIFYNCCKICKAKKVISENIFKKYSNAHFTRSCVMCKHWPLFSIEFFVSILGKAQIVNYCKDPSYTETF